ncbi:Sec-independent protein translocase protein TatB [uncultured Bartonella sp.]|uniref:Sec-independent protein translocase protein TatB n=1 Tax=uncultured Bartonella sp. TaxID=104108 RepID=UPI00261E306E|nr:Sec-independent protein translocase protein TatB [uncultured Bartonella sp.]
MFGIDGPEFIVILIVLIVVVGPKDLPKMLKALGKATARMRTTANEFRRQFDEAMHEADLDDLQKTISDVGNLDPRKKLTKIFDPIRDVAKDVKASIEVKEITDANADGGNLEESSVEKDRQENKNNGHVQSLHQVAESSVRVEEIDKRESDVEKNSTGVFDSDQEKKSKASGGSTPEAPARTKNRVRVGAKKTVVEKTANGTQAPKKITKTKKKSDSLSMPAKTKISGSSSLKS